MELLLTTIGFLGLGALVIAAWVFVSAARRYVSGEERNAENEALDSDLSPYRDWASRDGDDRRQQRQPVDFPVIIVGERIDQERRRIADRRGGRQPWVQRSALDRRREDRRSDFPLALGDEVIEEDRRSYRERRRSQTE